MSNTKILALFLIIAPISKSLQLTINCDYIKTPTVNNGRLKYKLVKEPYSCVLSTLNIKSKLLVQNITGKHLDKNTNDDVKALKIIGGGIISSTDKERSDNVLSVCKVIPAGIGSVFRKIEALSVWRSNLKSVSSRDLRQFANLREIWLFRNELEYLESKLFQYNPNVEVIKFIGDKIFKYLPKLQKTFFHYNPCVDGEAVDGTQLAAIKNTIKEKCAVKETAQPLHVTVDCKFELSSVWKTVKDPYGCTLQKSNFDRKLFIGNVTGSHAKGRSIRDVRALQIVGGVCQIIPGEFGSIFQNIEALLVKKASLKLVTGGDLQQFSNLREIWLESNDLNYLEGELFEFNPNVELIVFKDNQIKFVGENFFSYIPKLREADFSGNECFDDGKIAGLNLNAVQQRVKEKCVVDEPTFIYTTIRPDGLTYWDSRKSGKDDAPAPGAYFNVHIPFVFLSPLSRVNMGFLLSYFTSKKTGVIISTL